MRIDLGASVQTLDGQEIGRVDRVILDFNTRTVSDLVVKKGLILTRDVVIPLSLVGSSDETGIRLSIGSDEVEELRGFVDTDYFEASAEDSAPYVGGQALLPLMPSYGSGYAPSSFQEGTAFDPNRPDDKLERSPLGGSEITEGMEVRALDGSVGKVDRVLTDPSSNRLSALVIKKGVVFSRNIRVPIEWVSEVAPDHVQLSLTKAQVEQLPIPIRDHPPSDGEGEDRPRRHRR